MFLIDAVFSILHGSLEFFRFGDVIKQWTKILYKDFSVKIQNNGFSPLALTYARGYTKEGAAVVYTS